MPKVCTDVIRPAKSDLQLLVPGGTAKTILSLRKFLQTSSTDAVAIATWPRQQSAAGKTMHAKKALAEAALKNVDQLVTLVAGEIVLRPWVCNAH